ncbi:MAG: hypothetical protein IJ752_02630 [Alphaproteobacteria bacterium]|nr:hypothetical protein [Alphaproteobacteria bacterium]
MDLAEKTEAELISEYAAAHDQNDASEMAALQNEAVLRLNSYLAGELPVSEDEAPLFFSFIKAFSKTENVELNMSAKKAEAKITPLLKEFDKEAGYDRLAALSSEKIEENIAALEDFDTIDPFEKQDGKLIFPQFEEILKVIGAVVLTDGDQPAEQQEQESETFKETIVETAKLKAYMRLCVYTGELTQDIYLQWVRFEMEKALITLFMMEQTTELALDQTDIEGVRKAFDCLLDLL